MSSVNIKEYAYHLIYENNSYVLYAKTVNTINIGTLFKMHREMTDVCIVISELKYSQSRTSIHFGANSVEIIK